MNPMDTCFGCPSLQFLDLPDHRFGCWFCKEHEGKVIGEVGEVVPLFGNRKPYLVCEPPRRIEEECWRYDYG